MSSHRYSYEPAGEQHGLTSIDADTTDYYDGPDGLPPPHRISSRFSGSPYPEARNSADLPLQNPTASTSAYSDPFQQPPAVSPQPANPFASPSASFDAGNRYSMNAPGAGAAAAAGAGAGAGAGAYSYGAPPHSAAMYDSHGAQQMQQTGYDTGRPSGSFDDFGYRNDNDTWAAHADDYAAQGSSQGSLARDRYLQRKEAEAASNGGLLGGGSKEGAYGYAGSMGKRQGLLARRKGWFIGGGIVLLVIIAAVVGAIVATSKSGKSGGSAKASGVVKQDGNDPSNFEKDPRLHNSFYGMCYTPLNAQYPACGDSLEAVIEDVQLMSQLSTRLRLYGADCNVTALVLEAVQRTKVNMTVYPAIWINDDDTIYQRGAAAVINAIKTYGVDHIDGITVGNEYLLNNNGAADLATKTANLIAKMADFKSQLAALSLPKTIPVGFGEAGSMITPELAQAADFVMANNHAFFAGTTVQDAAGWTWSYSNNETPKAVLDAGKTLYIAETGWPSGFSPNGTTATGTYEGAVAGVPELQTFLDSYICQANANGTTAMTFYFEAFDEPWKDALYGGVEAHWGLFTSDKKLKDITIPDCAHL